MASILTVSLLVLGAVFAGVTAWRALRRERGEAMPCCAVCGYPAIGNASWTCAECGCDLRWRGIYAPGMRLGLSLGGRLGWWTFGVASAGVLVTMLLIAGIVPRVHTLHHEAQLTNPGSKEYSSIAIARQGRSFSWPLVMGSARPHRIDAWMTLNLDNGDVSRARYDASNQTLRVISPTKQRWAKARPFGQKAFKEWFRAIGIDVGNPSVAVEISQLMHEARGTTQGRMLGPGLRSGSSSSSASGFGFNQKGFDGRSGSSSYSTQPLGAVVWSIAVGWVIVWIIGVWRIVRRDNRISHHISHP